MSVANIIWLEVQPNLLTSHLDSLPMFSDNDLTEQSAVLVQRADNKSQARGFSSAIEVTHQHLYGYILISHVT
jgi:hypothetical protein